MDERMPCPRRGATLGRGMLPPMDAETLEKLARDTFEAALPDDAQDQVILAVDSTRTHHPLWPDVPATADFSVEDDGRVVVTVGAGAASEGELRQAVAAAIEEIKNNSLEEHLETLAYHYKKGDRPEKAFEFLVRAGQKAMEFSSTEVAKGYFIEALKIAPEHFSPKISKLMNKDNSRFEEFQAKFDKINNPLHQTLKYYFITAHPGSTMEDARDLRRKLQKLGFKNTESIQIFTPTPMSISTCMYYTGLNPYTLEKVYVPYSYNEKKRQKNILYPSNLPNSSNSSNSSNISNSSNPLKYPNRSYKTRKSR